MDKLVFNRDEKTWIIKKESGEKHPASIRKFQPLLELFKAADFFYWIVGEGSGKKSCSSGVKDVLGYSVSEFKRLELADLVHPDDLPAMEEFLIEAEEFLASLPDASKPFCKVQFTLRVETKEGLFKKVMLQKIPDIPEEGKSESFMMVMTDLSKLNFDLQPSLSLVHFGEGHSMISFWKDRSVEELPDLSPREWEVLELMTELCDVSAVADRIGVKLYTMRNHIRNIKEKLNVKSVVHMLALAEDKKWITRRDEKTRGS